MPQLLDYTAWNNKIAGLGDQYQRATPYPHIVIDNFLDKDILEQCLEEFKDLDKTQGWINYVHYNEKKKGLNKLNLLPPVTRQIIEDLNTPLFLDFLSAVTGIKNLRKDDRLEGGGIHQSGKGGFLNIHADFTVHPHHSNWQRRINVLIYLNKGWKDEWGGMLELWDKQVQKCEIKITPAFNRCVIFNTDADSFHGHPEPMTCPENEFRRSIALYYYTVEDKPFKRATYYKTRPGDGNKKLMVTIDNTMLSAYTRLKGWLGSNDKFISDFLRLFSRKKRRGK